VNRSCIFLSEPVVKYARWSALVCVVGCGASPVAAVVEERAGLVIAEDPWGDGATKLIYLDQGWAVGETLWYYYADQGSMLLPYKTFVNLEQPDNDKRLIDPSNVVRFRFLPQRPTPNNPDALPVGWSRHGDSAGLTCAACHTGQLTYRGTALRIDGAPSSADIIGFFHQIRDALAATLADEAKFNRFVAATRVGRPAPPDDSEETEARQALTDSLTWFDGYFSANRSTTVEGYGRLDAVGRIINQVIRFTSDPSHSAEPNAPTSFPLLWDAPRHDYVQWAGFSPNAELGSLGRNAGEVIGVYGYVEVKHYNDANNAKRGYPSSIQGVNLVAMEDSLHRLQSPVWPEDVLPPIDRILADRGAALYQTECISCHALLDRDDPNRTVVAMVTGVEVVGTDPQSVDNLLHARAPTGILEGAISSDGTRTYGATESGLTLLKELVTGVLSAQAPAAVQGLAYAKRYGLVAAEKQGDHAQPSEEDPTADLRSYKARPLNGTWATSPYLHNGSVPTLYDLLLPVEQRPARFAVGRWGYDPVKVGYVSEGALPGVLDTSVTGNHNVGHTYGTALADADRWALVEYLKTL
jgi:hypothetical protein